MSGYRQLEAKARKAPKARHTNLIQHHSGAYEKAKARKGFEGYYHNVFDDGSSGVKPSKRLRGEQDKSAHAKLERQAFRVVLDENKKLAEENKVLAHDMKKQEVKASRGPSPAQKRAAAAHKAAAQKSTLSGAIGGVPLKGIARAQRSLEDQLKDLERQQHGQRLAVEERGQSSSASVARADRESAEELKQEKARTATELKALGAQAKKYQARLVSLLDTSKAHSKAGAGGGSRAEKLRKLDPAHSHTEKELAAALESPTRGTEKARLDREVKGMLGYDTKKVARLSHAEWQRISAESSF